MTNRIHYYDTIKGVAIFLVALGHVLQSVLPNYREDKFLLLIVMFHMPLFMMVSGYFFLPSLKKTNLKEYVIKRFLRLYLPSLFWGIFQAIMIGGG